MIVRNCDYFSVTHYQLNYVIERQCFLWDKNLTLKYNLDGFKVTKDELGRHCRIKWKDDPA